MIKEIYNMDLINHVRRISQIIKGFGAYLELDRHDLFTLCKGAEYHDIGKALIDQGILNKPGRLTDEEFMEIRKHPNLSYKIMINMGGFSDGVLTAVRQHHERIDGKGYPFGLKGEDISETAKILALCDSYEAMTSKRCYKEAMKKDEALDEIRKNLGTQFDEKLGLQFIKFASTLQ